MLIFIQTAQELKSKLFIFFFLLLVSVYFTTQAVQKISLQLKGQHTWTLHSLSQQTIQEWPTVVTESWSLVIVNSKSVRHVDFKTQRSRTWPSKCTLEEKASDWMNGLSAIQPRGNPLLVYKWSSLSSIWFKESLCFSLTLLLQWYCVKTLNIDNKNGLMLQRIFFDRRNRKTNAIFR